MPKYIALKTVLVKGSRVEKGETVEVDDAYAQNIGKDYLKPLQEVKAEESKKAIEESKEVEKPLEELSFEELKEKAESLGLSTKGKKADILERITLSINEEE